MLVIRITNIIKPGHMDELVAVYKAAVEALGRARAVRTYVSMFGPLDTLNVEVEYESIEEWKSAQEDLKSSTVPEWIAFTEKLEEVRLAGGSCEVWKLV